MELFKKHGKEQAVDGAVVSVQDADAVTDTAADVNAVSAGADVTANMAADAEVNSLSAETVDAAAAVNGMPDASDAGAAEPGMGTAGDFATASMTYETPPTPTPMDHGAAPMSYETTSTVTPMDHGSDTERQLYTGDMTGQLFVPNQFVPEMPSPQGGYQNIPVMQCVGLQMRYGRTIALNGLSFSVGQGRILGLLGPNGSGKTTLMKLAAGLLAPSKGSILIAGTPPDIHSKEIVSYLPDRNFLDGDMTFKNCCRLFKSFYADFDRDRAMRMVQDLGINPKQRFKTLSKGNRDKVQLILTMSRRSMLYLLDEPIAGVDPATRDYILDTIIMNRNPGSTVIISTHLIQDVEKILDDVLFLKEGNIALYNSAEAVREENMKSVDEVFREIYAYHPGTAGRAV